MAKDLVKLVKDKQLFNKTEPIIVALSGGVDSMVLFDIIHKLNNNVIIAHVNHNKRDESIEEYNYIKAMAKSVGVRFEGYTIKQQDQSNFQHDSRLKRYDFFKAIAAKYNSKKIAVAHHLDDQVETVLMRIVRGTSFSGYTGIKEIRMDRNVSIIRPLMNITKEDIITYAEKHDIAFFNDHTNQEDVYTRNRFRNHIIPLLKEENPNLESKIIQLAEYIDSADELIEAQKRTFLREYSMYNHVSLHDFNKLNKIVKIKIIQHMVNQATNNSVEVSYEQYKQIIELCYNEHPNQRISLSDDYDFVKEYDVIYVTKLEDIVPIMIQVNKVGEYFVSDERSFVFTTDKMVQNNSNYFELCYNKLVFPLYIRQRQNGDKMSLSVGTKKVKDILIDQKVPKSVRDRLLVIATETEVLWIPGIKKAHTDRTCEHKLYIYEVK
ncbi:tRNA lysidine(34) synthetase TilS [Candidatus Xianfuyuplasma coldseepsis]|uniref:tRNA(Ile)-lysidine synthase n=1 Tax=Candidatus Xianfuyuplasma coldseepsis TaxID=2782163 RepID=A0A7L7KST9_9MOLU|nr:tRNA lysidine(34) synthetase TilS [Xianfuyuplasma coldseepsis]QMS85004.1 tRNA lysidine(34) synthetase TilS [Xianfuyuplasma coldseepsis]